MLLLSGILFVEGVFALVVGNWIAVLICFGLSYLLFLPSSFITIRKMLGVWEE